jgi:hypothetical protein
MAKKHVQQPRGVLNRTVARYKHRTFYFSQFIAIIELSDRE